MKLKCLGFMGLFFWLGTVSATAQVSGETEAGTDGKQTPFFSQYVFDDFRGGNVLLRYFWVKDGVNRGEFAVGPTFKLGGSTLKLDFGGDTDRDVMVAATLITVIGGHGVVYIADAKISTTRRSDTLYQKVFVALVKSGRLQFRAEHLLVGTQQGFLRVGGEFRLPVSERVKLFVAPFGDPINKGLGMQAGIRF